MTRLFMGKSIASSFVHYSTRNTVNNIETMGILFGKASLDGKKMKCKKFLLLNQTGNATNCQLTNEGETQLGEAIASAGENETVIGLITKNTLKRLRVAFFTVAAKTLLVVKILTV